MAATDADISADAARTVDQWCLKFNKEVLRLRCNTYNISPIGTKLVLSERLFAHFHPQESTESEDEEPMENAPEEDPELDYDESTDGEIPSSPDGENHANHVDDDVDNEFDNMMNQARDDANIQDGDVLHVHVDSEEEETNTRRQDGNQDGGRIDTLLAEIKALRSHVTEIEKRHKATAAQRNSDRSPRQPRRQTNNNNNNNNNNNKNSDKNRSKKATPTRTKKRRRQQTSDHSTVPPSKMEELWETYREN